MAAIDNNTEYLRKNEIPDLFDRLVGKLLAAKPENHVAFLTKCMEEEMNGGSGGNVLKQETKGKQRTIGLFGSSCNPPTAVGGHGAIVRYFSTMFDELWILPVYKHIFDTKQGLAPFQERYTMAILALEPLAPNVRVTRIEQEVSVKMFAEAKANGIPDAQVRIGSYDVIGHLQQKHPDVKFKWIMGGDTYNDLRQGKWKNSDALQKMVEICVVHRPGQKAPDSLGETATIYQLPETYTDISSTQVRASTDREFLSKVLGQDVLSYIENHKLYGFKDDK